MDTDEMELEEDIGEATIVYEAPDEGTVEKTVPNEHTAYFQDHWIIKTDEDDQGRDTVRRIPHQRVYYVERTVEEFEQEIETLYDRFESFATSIQTKLPIGSGGREQREEPTHVRIDANDSRESTSENR